MDDAQFRLACEQLKIHSYKFSSAVYGVESEIAGELIGSGTFLRIGGAELLMTAGHVAADTTNYIACCYSAASDVERTSIDKPWVCFSTPFDLAYVRLDTESLSGIDRCFAETAHLAEDSKEIEGSPLLVLGFPGVKSQSSALLKAIRSTSLPYVTGISKAIPRDKWFDPAFHFVIDYATCDLRDETGEATEFVVPHGLSGGAVWSFGKPSDSWTPEDAKIIGIAFAWDRDANTLIALRIEIVRELILQQLRREFAYFRWLERGCPDNDELADWMAAIEAIPER